YYILLQLFFHDLTTNMNNYETLRTTGVILAVVMFVAGILIALSNLNDKNKEQKSRSVLKIFDQFCT
uniref:FXYD domain-containing ion transport regulator n=1 Tax=Astyanax mexicanus TaxID=7994 RepID=A0A3B1JZ87_ASTMX